MAHTTIYAQSGRYDVRREQTGKSVSYCVYRAESTHAVRVATFGAGLANAFDRAIREMHRRAAWEAEGKTV